MKKLIRLAIVLVVLVVVALVGAFIYIDKIAKAAIEKGGTYALGVETTLESADVQIFAGRFSMSGLRIANPEGFDGHFMTLEDGGVEVSLGTLRNDTVEINELTLADIDLSLERRDDAANYKVILANLKKLESEDDDDSEGKKFIIKKVVMRDIMVHVNLFPGGELTRLDIPFEEIILEDVGSETSGGMLLSDLSGTLIKALLAAVVNKGGDLIPADLLGELEGGLDQLTSLGDMGIDLASNLGDVTEALGQAAELKKKFSELGDIGGKTTLPDIDFPDLDIGGLLGGDDDE